MTQGVLDDIDVAVNQLREIQALLRERQHSAELLHRAKAWSSELVQAVDVAHAELTGRQRPVLYVIRDQPGST